MSVQNSTSKVQYTLTGSGQTLSVPFYFLANDHLKVVKTSTTGVDSTLVLSSDYTVTGAGVESGGSITLSGGAADEVITILRNIPATQLVDYIFNDAFPAETHERALDKLTMLLQQVAETSNRTLRYPESESLLTSSELPSAADRANKIIGFDSSGDILFLLDSESAASAAATSAAEAAASAASINPLNLATKAEVTNLSGVSDQSTARTNIGLGNVNNTADVDKPVSTAQAAADSALGSRISDVENAQAQGRIAFLTKAAMDADLAHDEGTIAEVGSDSTDANNGAYQKQGASGAGSWTKVPGDLSGRVTSLENTVSPLVERYTRMLSNQEFTVTDSSPIYHPLDSSLLQYGEVETFDGVTGFVLNTEPFGIEKIPLTGWVNSASNPIDVLSSDDIGYFTATHDTPAASAVLFCGPQFDFIAGESIVIEFYVPVADSDAFLTFRSGADGSSAGTRIGAIASNSNGALANSNLDIRLNATGHYRVVYERVTTDATDVQVGFLLSSAMGSGTAFTIRGFTAYYGTSAATKSAAEKIHFITENTNVSNGGQLIEVVDSDLRTISVNNTDF